MKAGAANACRRGGTRFGIYSSNSNYSSKSPSCGANVRYLQHTGGGGGGGEGGGLTGVDCRRTDVWRRYQNTTPPHLGKSVLTCSSSSGGGGASGVIWWRQFQSQIFPSRNSVTAAHMQVGSNPSNTISFPGRYYSATDILSEGWGRRHQSTPPAAHMKVQIDTPAELPKVRVAPSTSPNITAAPVVVSHGEMDVDVAIIGGGVTGTALLYQLAKFTDLKRLALFERRSEIAVVASHGSNNSQTIHCGDIETNYSITKAKAVKRHADMLRNYATKLPDRTQQRCVMSGSKMALGVGEDECEFMEKRYHVFKEVFPKMVFLNKKQIAEAEPRVGMINSHMLRHDTICASYTANEHTTIDFQSLAQSFVENATSEPNKKVNLHMRTEVQKIEHDGDNSFVIRSSKGISKAKFVVVSACGGSLLMAQRMGYGLEFSCMPVAGSFYFAPYVLNGKVYTVQNPKLPFAAIHGDPDVLAKGKTRFGPTALPLPLLERYNYSTFKDFLEVMRPDLDLVRVYWDLLKVSTVRNYVLRNFLFEVPVVNKLLFVSDARKIIPTLKTEDLTYATLFGGVRPQLIDKKQQKLLLGEGKINPGTGIIFNVTPSPGATTCLGNGEDDMRTICSRLGAKIDEKLFSQVLLEGQYPVSH